MDYSEMADKLIKKMGEIHRTPRHREMNEYVQGEKFVLNYLAVKGTPIPPGELRDAMNLSAARVSAVLRILEQKKLIVRSPDTLDRRRVQVELTPAGEKKIISERKKMHLIIEDTLRELGENDVREYLRILGRLAEIGKKSFPSCEKD